ncbi:MULTISPECIES: hypothetical protein [unclassified Acinetobacter]|uniref:hypothetical protein n=1 Tax=unclassified Acinetobacter TaxID=196816 RepID=UPI0035B91FF0
MKKSIQHISTLALSVTLCSTFAYAKAFDPVGAYSTRATSPDSGGTTIVLYPDHRFAIAAFGTMLAGTWAVDGDVIRLKMEKPDYPYAIYARYNPKIKSGMRIMVDGDLGGFGRVSIGTNNKVFFKVVNDNANCTKWPYIANIPVILNNLSLFVGNDESNHTQRYDYKFGQKYNDIILQNLKPQRERDIEIPLALVVDIGAKPNKVQREEGQYYTKEPISSLGEEDSEFLKQISQIRLNQLPDSVYFNANGKDYNPLDEDVKLEKELDFMSNDFFLKDYTFNTLDNSYRIKKPDTETPADDYHNNNVIYKFDLMKMVNNVALPKKMQAEKSLLHYTCPSD